MRYTFNFPDLGEGLEEGTILEWFVKVGDKVKEGDPIVQMETDKVVADIPSPKSGIIAARYGNEGDVIHVGSALVEIEMEEGEAVVGTMELAGKDDLLATSNEGIHEIGKSDDKSRKVLATPVARALAKELGIDINEVPGSGPSGRVKKEDILNYSSTTGQMPDEIDRAGSGLGTGTGLETGLETGLGTGLGTGAVLGVETEDVTYRPLSQLRKTIARNMLHSKHNAAHMSVFEEVEISLLKQVVEKYKPKFGDKGVKLTYLSFIVKAVAQALKQHPQLNSQIDMENNRMIYRNRYHIGMAVDAPDGLVVPVIRDADRLSIFEIASAIEGLAAKARERKLVLDDMKDGSFSITSFGSIGGIFATPVIHYPQAGILGIGRILKTPIVKNDDIVVGNVMPLSLTVDHRIVDGGETTRFLKRVMEYLSDPVSLLMDE